MASLVARSVSMGTDLEGQGVDLLSHRDEPRIVVIQALPYPDISIVATGDNVPEEQPIKSQDGSSAKSCRVKKSHIQHNFPILILQDWPPVEQPHKMNHSREN